MAVTQPLHPLATAWLERVERLAADLDPGARSELLDDLREHLDAALDPDADGAEVGAVLDRLGDPAEVVAAARADTAGSAPPPTAPPPTAPPPGGPAAPTAPAATSVPDGLTAPEVIAMAALVLAGLVGIFVWPLTILLWVTGIVLVAVRGRWQGGEVLAMVLLPVGWALPVLAMVVPVGTSLTSCFADSTGTEVCTTEQSGAVGGAWALVAMIVVLVLLVLGTRWLARAPRGRTARG